MDNLMCTIGKVTHVLLNIRELRMTCRRTSKKGDGVYLSLPKSAIFGNYKS